MSLRQLVLATLAAVGSALSAAAQQAPAHAQSIRLIVRGDDFGSTHAANLGMVAAFESGIMTSASVMVPGPWFLEAAALLRDHPQWSVGLHLTLTSEWNRLRWRPLMPAREVPSIVAPDGFMYAWYQPEPDVFTRSRRQLVAPRSPDVAEAEKELRKQIEVAQAAGLRIDHLDCHMWVACSADLLPILDRLSRELCVPLGNLRKFGERDIYSPPGPLPAAEVAREFRQWLDSLSPGLWLYVDHPAVSTPELPAVDTAFGPAWAEHRTAVLRLWTDPEIKQLMAERGIELVSYRDLWDYQHCRPK